MGKTPSRSIVRVASRRTRVLAAFALFLVLATPLAGTWPDQNAGAQVIWDFWMESDMDLYGNDQAIRLFGNIGYAIADHPVSIKVVDERNNIVKLGQAQTDASGDFEATVGPIPDDGSYIVQAEHEFAGSAWTTFTIGQLQLPEAVQEAEGQTVPEPEDVVPLPAAETGDAAAQSEQPTEREIITDIVDDSEDWLQFLLMLALGASVHHHSVSRVHYGDCPHHNTHREAHRALQKAESKDCLGTATQACCQGRHAGCPDVGRSEGGAAGNAAGRQDRLCRQTGGQANCL